MPNYENIEQSFAATPPHERMQALLNTPIEVTDGDIYELPGNTFVIATGGEIYIREPAGWNGQTNTIQLVDGCEAKIPGIIQFDEKGNRRPAEFIFRKPTEERGWPTVKITNHSVETLQ